MNSNMKISYSTYIGMLIRSIRLHHHLTAKQLIYSLGLSVNEVELIRIELGLSDIYISDFDKIISSYGLDHKKVYHYVSKSFQSDSLSNFSKLTMPPDIQKFKLKV